MIHEIRYVYGLTDSAEPEIIRYVGETNSLRRRFKEHMLGCKDSNARFWTDGLRIFRRFPEIHLLQVVYGGKSESLEYESEFIHKYEKMGRLLNGLAWARRCESVGVPSSLRYSYVWALETMFRMTDGKFRYVEGTILRFAARSLDILAKSFPEVCLFLPDDSFENTLCVEHKPRFRRKRSRRYQISQQQYQ